MAGWTLCRRNPSCPCLRIWLSDRPRGAAPPFSLTPYEQEAKERVGGELNALAHKCGVPAVDAMSSAALRHSTKSVGWQAKLAPTSLSCPRMDELAWSICSLAARPSERCGTRRVRCLSCAKGRWRLRKEGWLQKDPCAGRFLRLLARRTPVRDPIRGLLSGRS